MGFTFGAGRVGAGGGVGGHQFGDSPKLGFECGIDGTLTIGQGAAAGANGSVVDKLDVFDVVELGNELGDGVVK